ncbi:Lsr2 family DNA-binding protein, partial [Agromyces binzhouensis]
RRGGSAGAGDTKDAREWLRANGHQVSDRGRIPAPLMELYRNR